MSVCVLTHLIGQNDRALCKRHGDAFATLSVSRDPLSRVCASIMVASSPGPSLRGIKEGPGNEASIVDMFENATIALARWDIEPFVKRKARYSSLLKHRAIFHIDHSVFGSPCMYIYVVYNLSIVTYMF